MFGGNPSWDDNFCGQEVTNFAAPQNYCKPKQFVQVPRHQFMYDMAFSQACQKCICHCSYCSVLRIVVLCQDEGQPAQHATEQAQDPGVEEARE